MQSYIEEQNGIFPSVCSLDCPDQCGLLVHKKEGKIIKIEGDPNHPVTKGMICNKVRHFHERIYDQNRIQFPLKRIGKKGEGKFTRISWEEAIETITSRWKKLIEADQADRIMPYSFYGNMGRLAAEGMDRRFFHRLGATRLERTICSAAGTVGYHYTMGGSYGIDPEDTVHSKLIIFWGINAVSTNMHQIALAQRARKENKAKIVVIDVHRNQTAKFADWFIPILPGTDSALALGMMHILFAENMIDKEFLQKYTIGYHELQEHVKQYDPKTVSAITGVPMEDIYQLARMYGTTSPSYIRIGNGLQHHDNGGMNVRTIACLPALCGQWLKKGGGAIKGNSDYLAFNARALQRHDLLPNKKVRKVNMNQIGEALTSLEPPLQSLYVYNSNPAVVAPNGGLVRQGLEREDLFTIVHDLFITETAKYADIVLPAASSFESTDFYTSYWHHYMQIQQPVIAPYGEAKTNTAVFKLLAEGMGFNEAVFQETEKEMIETALQYEKNPYLKEITYDTLVEKQYVKADIKPLFPGRLKTPSGKIELYSKRLERLGLPPLPTYVPLVDDGEAEFLFVAAPNHHYLNSTFANNHKHQALEKEPILVMNEKDAAVKGIADGSMVKVWNHRGECRLKVSIGSNCLPGVVVTQGLWEGTDGRNRLVNTLTPDRLADMGGGAVFFSGKVNVTKVL